MNQQISFENHAGEQLAASLHEPENPSGTCMIMGHCFTCSRHTRVLMDLSRALSEEGVYVLRFDFSGNGKSEGNFKESTYTKQIREIESALAYMKSRYDLTRCVLSGHSMGAAAALLTAGRADGVSGVVAMAPGRSTRHLEEMLTEDQKEQLDEKGEVPFTSRGRELVLTRKFFDDAARYNLERAVSGLDCPVLIIQGEFDTILPVETAERLYENMADSAELHIVSGADHMFSADENRQDVVDAVLGWIKKIN